MTVFTISVKQRAEIDKWLKTLHRSKKPYYGRAVDYTFSYSSGVGVSLFVKDLKTGKVKDFTDYDWW